MIIRNMDIQISQDLQDIHYAHHSFSVPSNRQEMIAKIDAIITPDEYEEMMFLFRSQNGFGVRNVRLVNLVKNTLTEDIIQNNILNETFLLSLINGNICVIAENDVCSFKVYAEKHLPDFYEKYKLLFV